MNLEETLEELRREVRKVRDDVHTLVERQTLREWYSTEQFGKLVGRSEFTCREWCRLGRIHAEKQRSGRGAFFAWVIPHAELIRFQREGLLPFSCKNTA